MPEENELRGVDAAEASSTLLVGSAEYGTHARDPRRKTRFADGIDHIPLLVYCQQRKTEYYDGKRTIH